MTAAARRPLVTVRDAEPSDLARVQAIYAHHVLHGLASFEETPPDPEEILRRFEAVRALGLPYLVAEAAAGGSDPTILGYAYAAPYRPRPAYRFTIEDSVYVAPDSARRGAGRALLGELIARCTDLGYRQMIAIVGDSANEGSIRLHEASGFARVGLLRSVGFKFGRWVDSVMLQRPLGAGDHDLPAAPPGT
jgi:phosphinothricin acetyltransferase